MRPRVCVNAEVDERELLRLAPPDLGDRRVPGLDVDVRGRGDRDHVGRGGDPHAARVAGEQRPVAKVRHVVRRVADRRERLPAEDVAGSDAHVLLGHRQQLTPERVEHVAVEPSCGPLEPRGVDEVGSADLGDPDRQLRMQPNERAGRPGVVEVDVREQQVPQLGQLDAVLAEACDEPRQRRRRPAILQREAVGRFDQIHADRVLLAAEVQVDEAQLSHSRIF